MNIALVITLVFFAITTILFYGNLVGDISLSLFCAIIYSIFLSLFQKCKDFKQKGLSFQTFASFLIHSKRKVRVSVSYLYRIIIFDHVNNSNLFLLITNNTWGVVSPIGGVYKYFDSANHFLKEISAYPCIEAKSSNIENYDNDIRLLMPVRNLQKFLQWFDSGICREYDVMREFSEEIIESDLGIPANLGVKTYYKYSSHKRVRPYCPNKHYYELQHFDVFQLELDENLESEIMKCISNSLQQKDNNTNPKTRVFLATEDEILKGRLKNGLLLGDNVKYLL